MRMRSMADMIELQDLRKRVEEDEEYIRIAEEEFNIIAEVAEEIPNFTDNESILEIVQFIVAVATGDYEILEDEVIEDLEEVDIDDPWRYR